MIELFQPTEVVIVPNPAEGEVVITIRGEIGATFQMEFTNLIGSVIEKSQVKMETTELKIKKQLSLYPSGMYFLRIGNKIAMLMKM